MIRVGLYVLMIFFSKIHSKLLKSLFQLYVWTYDFRFIKNRIPRNKNSKFITKVQIKQRISSYDIFLMSFKLIQFLARKDSFDNDNPTWSHFSVYLSFPYIPVWNDSGLRHFDFLILKLDADKAGSISFLDWLNLDWRLLIFIMSRKHQISHKLQKCNQTTQFLTGSE